jgi:hypothetical protein
MPPGKRGQADPIILKLREAELELSRDKTVPEAAKKIGVTEQTNDRWTKKYGGLRLGESIETTFAPPWAPKPSEVRHLLGAV